MRLHGEAVATGMVMAANLSHRMGWISQADLERTKNIIQRAHLHSMSADSAR